MSDAEENGQRRLDVELVRRGLFVSRTQARAAIEAGKVSVGGAVAEKPGLAVGADAIIEAEAVHPWVSRGGVKLAHALQTFRVDPSARICLDIGASTGGFTEVLLAGGARKIIAVDVGRGQLHQKLRGDSRVVSLEATDARDLTLSAIGESPSLIVCDASFIGLAKVLARPLSLTAPEAELVGLFKPQFEVGPARVGKGGIVTDEEAIRGAAKDVEDWLQLIGWLVMGWTRSPIRGGDGNAEHLFHARRKT
jgi:23S rRNA (cytidine1920-2'-O)/16S rRNA (cytidine1409-2'-O)-methyltransferase